LPSTSTGGSGGRLLLTPEQLVRDFGRHGGLAREAIAVLLDALSRGARPSELHAEPGVTGSGPRDATARDDLGDPRVEAALRRAWADRGQAPARRLLVAVRTYYALVLKLLAWQVATERRLPEPGPGSPADRPANVREHLEEIESDRAFHRLGLRCFVERDLLAWYLTAWSPSVEELVGRMVARIAQYSMAAVCNAPPADLVKPLYRQLVPAAVRQRRGEYYTPDWLADHVLDRIGYEGDPQVRLIDPACGSGTFLVRALARVLGGVSSAADREGMRRLSAKVLQNVVGFDLDPLAVMAARLNYLAAAGRLLAADQDIEIPVRRCNAILAPPAEYRDTADFVAGNPPWMIWDRLSRGDREATSPLWRRYGLFTLAGMDARHGGGKKDLAALALYVAADAFLRDGGRLGFVVPQSLFQTRGAGEGFRRFRLGESGAWLSVLRVDDMARIRPFGDVANRASTIAVEKGRPTGYPVPYFRWTHGGRDRAAGGGRSGVTATEWLAVPVDRSHAASPWIVTPRHLGIDPKTLTGPSDYTAHAGAYTGGANGVLWVEVLGRRPGGVAIKNLAAHGKRPLAAAEAVVEPDLLFPLARWADVRRYLAVPSVHVLLTQDPATRHPIPESAMRSRYPRTYAYLQEHEPQLAARRSSSVRALMARGPFYAMFAVGGYTIAPVKVVWRRLDRRITAAVVEEREDDLIGRRPIVPQETCTLVAVASREEADYLCAVMNSAVVGFLAAAHSVSGGKGFGSPGMLECLRLRRFDVGDGRHRVLSRLGREASLAVARGEDVTAIQAACDEAAVELWDLRPEQARALSEVSSEIAEADN
jgi:hypothetical protein